MGIEARINQYWIASNAISITLNAMGEPNRIQGSVSLNAIISCYVEDVKPEIDGEQYAGNGDGLVLDNSRNPKRWPLNFFPTYFNSNSQKYVYVAIPRSISIGLNAIIVFPSEHIDIYGKDSNGNQIGSNEYFYVWLQGIISATDGTENREWIADNNFGSLGTYEDIIDISDGDWYQYSKITHVVTFLKDIFMGDQSRFQNMKALSADIERKLTIGRGLNSGELTGVAKAENYDAISEHKDNLIVTPSYLDEFGNTRFLRKDIADTAQGLITFLEGLKVGGGGVYGIDGTGVGRLIELITREVRGESYTGTDLLGDEGFRMWTDEYGKGHIITDYLTTRIRQIVAELEVKRITFTSGNVYLSAANARFTKVVPITENGRRTYAEILSAGGEVLTGSDEVLTGDSGQPIAPADTYAYRCYWPATDGERRTSNDWKVGDMAWCKTENLTAPGSFIDPQNRQYRRLVVAVGTELVDGENCHYIDLSAVLNPVIEGTARTGYDANLPGGNDAPMAGDEVAQVGSQTDTERQGVIALNPVSDNPNIAIYADVDDYNLPSHRVALLSPAEVNICASYFKLSTAVGTGKTTTPLLKPTVDMWWQNGQNLSVTNSIYVDADEESKIASLSQVQGLPVKIQVKLGNVVIPCSEWTGGTVDGVTIANSSSGITVMGTGVYVERAYKNTDSATVVWKYTPIPQLGGQPVNPVITSRKIVVAIAFTHDNQDYTVEQEIQMTVQVKGATGAAGQDGTSLNVRGEAELHYVSPSYMPSSDGTYLVDEDWNGTSGAWIVVIENQTESFSLATTGYCYKTLNASQGDASQEGHLWQAQSDGWHDIGPINASDAYSVLPDPSAISMEQNPTDNSWPQPKIGIKAMLGKNTRPYEITAVSSTELQVVRTDSNQKVQITGVNQNNEEYYINGTITITVGVDNKEFTVTVSVAMQPVGTWMLTVQNDTLESVSKKYIPFTTDQGGLVTGLGISAFKQSGDGFDFAVWKTVNGTTHTCDAGLSIYITTQTVDNQTVYEGHVEMTGSVHSKNTGTAQQPEYAWELKEDGTGHLAGGNISWDAAGNVTFSGELSAATGTFAGTLQGVSGTFDGELRAVNGKVYLTSSEVQESGANYTWKGLAVENGDGGDLATVGARTSQGDGSSYGRLVLVKRDAQGNAVNDDTVALDAGEGSIRAKAYKIQKYTVASPDADSTVATDVQLVICSNTSDRNLRLTFTPPVGTVIVIKKTTERGWLNVLDQQGNQIGKFDRGSIMCVYTPEGWK